MHNINNISFKGGYLLKNVSPKEFNEIYDDIMPNKRVIIPDLYNDGNVFFATKSCYDSSVLNYLIGKDNLKFTYYPNVNLKNQFSSHEPEEAMKSLDKEVCVESKKKIKKYINEDKLMSLEAIKYKWKPNDHIDKTMKTLNINPRNYKIDIKNGITRVKDKSGKPFMEVSPNNRVGTNYVFVYPRYGDEDFTILEINCKGEIINESTNIDDVAKYKKLFMNAVKIDLGRIRPQKNKD